MEKSFKKGMKEIEGMMPGSQDDFYNKFKYDIIYCQILINEFLGSSKNQSLKVV